MIAEVVFNIPLERSFHYLVPSPLDACLQPGMRVVVPFGPRRAIGFVIRVGVESPRRELKAISQLLDPIPVIGEERWALARWLSGYYGCSLGEALSAMVPRAFRWPSEDAGPSASIPPHHRAVHQALSEPQRRVHAVLQSALTTTKKRGTRLHPPQVIVLHGVTGSGKTELYLQAIDETLSAGRSAMCLVPEIALTPQAIDRFRARFGDRVYIWHSRLPTRQRSKTWRQLMEQPATIVVGTRSTIFLPVRALGLIILDEEHESTYKQEETPRYHARDVAITRAQLAGAVVVLGSATPSVETYYHATRGTYTLTTLRERVGGRSLPTVEIVDLRAEHGGRRGRAIFSHRLERALEQTIARGEQAMLLLNRRGFARIAQCPSCGFLMRCQRCTVPLIYHAKMKQLQCHYCAFHAMLPDLCTVCHKGYLRLRGLGTERVESELCRLFPQAAIARMDADTMKPTARHQQLYDAMKSQQVGIVVGTQMLAKGFDFPEVTLVGVVSADTSLNLPDFRAGERTFNLLTQMAGRAGRGTQPGQVIIQTTCPTHYAIQAAARHDYQRFYEEEMQMRKRLLLPPYRHLVELTVLGSSAQRVHEVAAELAAQLRPRVKARHLTLFGPAPHRIHKLRRTYRVCLLLKGRRVESMMALLRETLQEGRRFGGLPVLIDVDPL